MRHCADSSQAPEAAARLLLRIILCLQLPLSLHKGLATRNLLLQLRLQPGVQLRPGYRHILSALGSDVRREARRGVADVACQEVRASGLGSAVAQNTEDDQSTTIP